MSGRVSGNFGVSGRVSGTFCDFSKSVESENTCLNKCVKCPNSVQKGAWSSEAQAQAKAQAQARSENGS